MSVRVKRSYVVSVVSDAAADRVAEAIFDLVTGAAEGNPLYGAMVKVDTLAAREVAE